MKILDCIRIAKISELSNTTVVWWLMRDTLKNFVSSIFLKKKAKKKKHVAEPANRITNNKILSSTVVKVKTTPTFQPTNSRLSSGQMATRAGKH